MIARTADRRIRPLGLLGAGTVARAPAMIVTVREFRHIGRKSLVPFGRVCHRDAIEETWGRVAARRWMKRLPRASAHS